MNTTKKKLKKTVLEQKDINGKSVIVRQKSQFEFIVDWQLNEIDAWPTLN